MTQVMTHRGLDPSKGKYYAESSIEAFADQLERGYGLEFDLRLTKDGEIVISHDGNLSRISGGKVKDDLSDLTLSEIEKMEFNGCHLTGFDGLFNLIKKINNGAISAIHLKHASQNQTMLDKLLEKLGKEKYGNFIIFDVKPETARYLKSKNGGLELAPSVALPYDIKRYNSAVGGTLLSIEETENLKDLFSWVWLDEWDRTDENGGDKTLYNKEVFDDLRQHGFKIALVSPELHGSSPALLGGEAHQDVADKEKLHKRMREIAALKPDIICTDYPDLLTDVVKETELPKLDKR